MRSFYIGRRMINTGRVSIHHRRVELAFLQLLRGRDFHLKISDMFADHLVNFCLIGHDDDKFLRQDSRTENTTSALTLGSGRSHAGRVYSCKRVKNVLFVSGRDSLLQPPPHTFSGKRRRNFNPWWLRPTVYGRVRTLRVEPGHPTKSLKYFCGNFSCRPEAAKQAASVRTK